MVGFSYPQKIKLISYIFSLVAKSDIAYASSYILAFAKVILNKSTSCRKANITADRQYNLRWQI